MYALWSTKWSIICDIGNDKFWSLAPGRTRCQGWPSYRPTDLHSDFDLAQASSDLYSYDLNLNRNTSGNYKFSCHYLIVIFHWLTPFTVVDSGVQNYLLRWTKPLDSFRLDELFEIMIRTLISLVQWCTVNYQFITCSFVCLF